jgi:pSer/pThr/pTyr-binding forkhead associated (FHA) protein
MKLNLVVLTAGKKKGMNIPIKSAEFLIGRGPGCHLRPKSSIFSDRHCVLVKQGEQVFIRDLGSSNGTYVNQKAVQGDVELHDRDRLRVGFLSFQVQIEPEAIPEPPAPAVAVHQTLAAYQVHHEEPEIGLAPISDEVPRLAPIQEEPAPAVLDVMEVEEVALEEVEAPIDAELLEGLAPGSMSEDEPAVPSEQFVFSSEEEGTAPGSASPPEEQANPLAVLEMFQFDEPAPPPKKRGRK